MSNPKLSDWKTYSLCNISNIYPSNVDKKSNIYEKQVKLCNYMDVYQNEYITGQEDFMEATATDAEISKFQLKVQDVIITKDSETPDDIGIPTVILNNIPNVICGYHLALIRPKHELLDGIFLSKVLQTNNICNYLSCYANGSTRFGLSISSIENIQVDLPPLPEQRTIARVLTTIDNVIEKTEQLIKKLKDIKKGLMQDLFTRGVTPDGKLRPAYEEAPELYKDSELGWIPEEWDVESLENVSERIGDGIHATPEYVNNSDYYFINGNNLENGEIIINNNTSCVSTIEYKKHYIELNVNTILLSINGTIGNTAIYNNEKVILGKSAAYICCSKDLHTLYIYYLLNSFTIDQYFTNELTGTTIKNLSLNSIRNTPIPLPVFSEQVDIAAKILSIDNMIESEHARLKKHILTKKGLMDDLLTGKKRVTLLITDKD